MAEIADGTPEGTILLLQRERDALRAEVERLTDNLEYFKLLETKLKEASEAIKRGDGWPSNHWPSPVERAWHVAAQEELARLRKALEKIADFHEYGHVHEKPIGIGARLCCIAAKALESP